MSSTRRAEPEDDSPLSQERYMSSPEYAELRGVSGTAVAARAAIVDDPAIRRLLWFLQQRSLEPGGFKELAREILERCAHRIGTASMHKFGMNPGQIYSAKQVKIVREEFGDAELFPLRGEVRDWDSLQSCRCYRQADADQDGSKTIARAMAQPICYSAGEFVERCRSQAWGLAAFLTDLCINPRLAFKKADVNGSDLKAYRQRLEVEFPDQSINVSRADLWWFQDIVGALLEYQRAQEASIRADFVLTTVGRKVWETLDFGLKSKRMVVVEGWEGRGKSEATKAWCRMHSGEARFVSLKGVTNKTTVFREIARALGIACSYKRKSTEMQARVEDVLQRSRLMLVFDEAHYLFNQSARVYTRPEFIDWIDTALCNNGVPVALVTTPQIIQCVKRAEVQVGWNWRQFRRRVGRWVLLAEWNTDADLQAVASKIMPGISRTGIKLAIGYAKMSLRGSPSRDLSGLADVATEAKLIAEDEGRSAVTFADVERAINEFLIPSDTAFASRMAEPEKQRRRRSAGVVQRPAAPASPPISEEALEGAGADRPQAFEGGTSVHRVGVDRISLPRATGELVAA